MRNLLQHYLCFLILSRFLAVSLAMNNFSVEGEHQLFSSECRDFTCLEYSYMQILKVTTSHCTKNSSFSAQSDNLQLKHQQPPFGWLQVPHLRGIKVAEPTGLEPATLRR